MVFTNEQRDRVEKQVDRMLKAAETDFSRAAPNLNDPQFNNNIAAYTQAMARYNQDKAAHESNPLRAAVAGIKNEVEAQRRANVPEATIKQLYDQRMADLKANMMKGVDDDLVNKEAKEQAQQDLMNSLFPPSIGGIISSLMRMFSGTNDLLAVPGQMANDLINQNGIDAGRAVDTASMTSGIASALRGAGVDLNTPAAKQQIATAVANSAGVTAPPAGSQAAGSQPAGSQPAGSQPQPAFTAPNGALPPPPVATPAAPVGPRGIN